MIESILSSFALIVLSTGMLGLTCFSWRAARRIFNVPVVADLIFFFVSIKVIMYYLLPTFMRMASDYQFERMDGVAIADLIKVYSIELISWTVWATVLLWVFSAVSRNKQKIRVDDFVHLRYPESKIILVLVALGFVAFQITTLLKIELGIFFEVFKTLFFFAGLTAGPFLAFMSLRYYSKPLFILGICTALLGMLSLATRGAIVYFLLFSLFLAWFILRDNKSKAIVCSMISVLVIVYFTLGGLLFGSIFIDETGSMRIDAGIAAEKTGGRSPLEEFEWRLGAATRLGTSFIRLYDRGEGAGFNPIKNSLKGFLPRSINPDKPHPSTLDGDDIYSMGMYIIYREIYGYDTFSMVEFPTGAHFYWEFGILGVLIFSAISGLYVALCAHFFAKLGVVALPLMVAIFKPWGYVDPKIWVSDIAMQIYQIVLPLILLVCIIRFMRYGSKVLAVAGITRTRKILG